MDVLLENQRKREEKRRIASDMVVKFRDMLTETQFRRLWMYHVDGRTLDEIAENEGISHQNVSKSITAAEKKIKKFSSES